MFLWTTQLPSQPVISISQQIVTGSRASHARLVSSHLFTGRVDLLSSIALRPFRVCTSCWCCCHLKILHSRQACIDWCIFLLIFFIFCKYQSILEQVIWGSNLWLIWSMYSFSWFSSTSMLIRTFCTLSQWSIQASAEATSGDVFFTSDTALVTQPSIKWPTWKMWHVNITKSNWSLSSFMV